MKLFVAVILFVSVPIAFADDVTWRSIPDWSLPPGAYVYEGVPVPEPSVTQHPDSDVKTQNLQEHPKQTVSSTEQSRTNPTNTQTQAPDQGKEEELEINRDANEIAKKENTLSDEGNRIQRNLVAIGLITIFTQVVLTLVQIHFIQTANQHAAAAGRAAKDSADAAKEGVEVADRAMRIANRAYLFVKEWEVQGLHEDEKPTVTCVTDNAGRTPATLEKRYGWCRLVTENPSPLTPACLNNVVREGMAVNVDGTTYTTFDTPHIGTVEWRALKEKTQFLYVTICFVYGDVFDQRYWVVSSGVYDIGTREFRIVDGREYNCHGVYREEDWADENI